MVLDKLRSCAVIAFPIVLLAGCGNPSSPGDEKALASTSTAYAVVVGVRLRQGQTVPDAGTAGSANDALTVTRILRDRGFRPDAINVLISEQARVDVVRQCIDRVTAVMRPNDLFVLYFSGHGGQVTDQGRLDETVDGLDETICCFDGDILDDELLDRFQRFPSGARLLFINDACNSATTHHFSEMIADKNGSWRPDHSFLVPYEPLDQELSTDTLAAQLIYFGGARDAESSYGIPAGGRFTLAMRDALAIPGIVPSYPALYGSIKQSIRQWQVPTYSEMGPVTDAFRKQPPFTIQ